MQGVTFQTNIRILCAVTCTKGVTPCTNVFTFNVSIVLQYADVLLSISRNTTNTKCFKQYATSTIQFILIYLPAYSTAKMPITELASAHTKQTNTHKQKTKHWDTHTFTQTDLGGGYEIPRCDGLRWHYVHTKFHKDQFMNSKLNWEGMHTMVLSQTYFCF
jgi:hypothetical protein